jgi:septum formation protein
MTTCPTAQTTQTIILGSQSLIRQRALNLLGLSFICIPSHIDEKAIRDPDPLKMAVKISEAKALEIAKNHQGIIISGDAFLVHKGKILEKPHSLDEARSMIKSLSGSTYQFVTALVVFNTYTQRLDKAVEVCSVTFRDLIDEEIEDYITKKDVLKYAGAHETDGAVRFSKHVEGNFNLITALPMDKLIEFLRNNEIQV